MTASVRASIAAGLEAAGVVAVIRIADPSKLGGVVAALVDGGVRALEVTMTVPGAIELIRQTAATLPPGFLLGAGTVTDAETVARVVDAGATFIVSPIYRRSVLDAAHAHQVASLPGCLTPTEILEAWEAGADIVKVFPATALGPGYLKDLRGPMPQVKLMPTGGVTVDNAGDWIKAGAVAVGVGTSLLDASAIANDNFSVIADNARRIVANVQRARGQVR
jgi:2-dehydro-3-deoxyphosphogluconate aldolase/(4S)-4-hydroxy-2-oxoglutarate aldolase